MILLYMRSTEGHLSLELDRGRLKSTLSDGPAPQAAMPEADELAHRLAAANGGVVQSLLTESLLGRPTTAHILGGCCIGATPAEGVIDTRHRVFGYDGLYVVDGSAVSANPGVNPSLTITAMAERAMSFV
jgi:cholesterol oxidase